MEMERILWGLSEGKERSIKFMCEEMMKKTENKKEKTKTEKTKTEKKKNPSLC